jgi:Type IV Pilus-assembly protein W
MNQKTQKYQQGLSLIELMVASTAGILILTCLVQAFYATSLTYNTVNAQAELGHTGQVTTDILVKTVYHAGYWDDVTYTKLFANEKGFTLNGFITGVDAHTTNPDRVEGSDSLQLRLTGASDDAIFLCNGDPLADGHAAIQHLYLKPLGPDLIPTLICDVDIYEFDKIAGSMTNHLDYQSVSLIEHIETFQVLYGVGTGNNLRWVKANDVTDWSSVRMLQFGILVGIDDAMPLSTSSHASPKTYAVFEKSVTPAHTRPMRVFTRSVSLRNSLAGGS